MKNHGLLRRIKHILRRSGKNQGYMSIKIYQQAKQTRFQFGDASQKQKGHSKIITDICPIDPVT